MRTVKTRSRYSQRERRIASLERRLLRKSYPRLHASLILLLTGLTGFLASFVLLQLGMDSMWLRYPIAILVAYCMFLLLLRVWLWLNRPTDAEEVVVEVVDTTLEVMSPDSTTYVDPGFGGAGDFGGGGAGGEWVQGNLSVTSTETVSTFTTTPIQSSGSTGWSFDFDLEDGWIIVVAIVALIAAAIAAFYVVYIAPALLAEILLDGVLLAGLYKRVKTIEHRHWLRGALRRTVLPAILVAVFFSVAGFAMQAVSPEARSVGEFWRSITVSESDLRG